MMKERLGATVKLLLYDLEITSSSHGNMLLQGNVSHSDLVVILSCTEDESSK